MYRFSALLLAVCGCTGAFAATFQQLSMDEMTQAATAIVRARVTGASASFTGSTIYTHYQLQTSETWKGAPAAEAMLPGGISGKFQQSFPGVPTLQTGSEYVLFLWKSSTGITYVIGFSQGIFALTPQADGSMQASRPQIGETMHDAKGQAVQDHAVRMSLGALRSTVRLSAGTGVAR